MRFTLNVWMTALVVALLAVCAVRAEAYSYSATLEDNPFMDDIKEYDTGTGGMYRFSLTYEFETASEEVLNAATNHDTFFYVLMTGPSLDDLEILIDNSLSVDIVPPTLRTFASIFLFDQYIVPYFIVANGNSDFTSKVHIQYTIEPFSASAVPEPSTMILLGAGSMALLVFGRRKTK